MQKLNKKQKLKLKEKKKQPYLNGVFKVLEMSD